MIRWSSWIAVLLIATGVCNAQHSGNPSNGIGIKVKKGNLVFSTVENGKAQTATFIFDDFGAAFRIEVGNECTVADAATQKAYKLNSANKTYSEEDYAAVRLRLQHFFYIGEDATVKKFPDYKKLPDRTVAGKDCTVFSFTDQSKTITIGEWRGLLFLKESQGNTFTATSFSETIPENSFSVPSNYQLVKN